MLNLWNATTYGKLENIDIYIQKSEGTIHIELETPSTHSVPSIKHA